MKALQFSVSVPQYIALKTLGRLARRAYYDSPLATVHLVEVPEPGLLSPDWVKLKTLVCGFCGSDLNLILLRDSPMASPFTSFPCTLGHEFSGEVVEVGGNVTGVAVGDIVTAVPTLSCVTRGIDPPCHSCRIGKPGNCENFAGGNLAPGMFTGICRDVGGGFAPYLVAHKSQVLRLSEGMMPEEGAMIEPLAAALQTVLDNRPQEDDEHVLVIGGGVIGNLIVQSIRALGIKCAISVSEPSPFHGDLASKAGANHVIEDGDTLGHAIEATGARRFKPMLGGDVLMGGFSRIYDTVASRETIDAGLRSLRTGGVLSVVGISRDVMSDPTPLWLKLQTIKGAYCYGYTEVDGARRHVFEVAMDMVAHGKVDVASMVTHRFALDDYRKMIEVNLSKSRHQAVKTVVTY